MKRAAVTVFSLLLSALLPFGACAATVSGSVIPSVVIEDGQVKIDAEITGYYAESGTEIFLFRCDSENEKPEIPLSAATAAKSLSIFPTEAISAPVISWESERTAATRQSPEYGI